MNEDDSKRQAQAILYIAGVFKLALLNTAFFVSSSFLLTIIGSPFLSEIVGRGIYPELSNYCSTRECVYSASTVSAIYFFHGIYSIAFILSILYKYRRLRDTEKSKDFYLMCAMSLSVVVICVLAHPFGFERHRVFSNYVYKSEIYILYPAFIMLLFCTFIHFLFVSAKFNTGNFRRP